MKRIILILLVILFVGVGVVNACHKPPPCAVNVVYFTAIKEAGGIRLTWETSQEVTTIGFEIYRVENGISTKITDPLISTKYPGQLIGSTYEFIDTTAVPGILYRYTLKNIELNGGTDYTYISLYPFSVLVPIVSN